MGYRAPTYSIVASSLWALEILVDLGFTYDSSIFPIRHDRYGIPSAPRAPFRIKTPSGPLLEYPLTTFRIGKHSLPVGGGGYLRLLPRWYTRFGVRPAEVTGRAARHCLRAYRGRLTLTSRDFPADSLPGCGITRTCPKPMSV